MRSSIPLILLYALLYRLLVADHAQDPPGPADGWRTLLSRLLVFTLGAGSLWLLTWLLWSVPPWSIAQTGLQQHYSLVTNLRRYDWWVIWNLIDLALFAGWPMLLGFLGSLVVAAWAWRRRQLSAVDILSPCLLFLIILLDISGSARGEVGRIWLFFMPLLAFPAARFWSLALPGRRRAWTITALQLLLVLCLGHGLAARSRCHC